MKKNFSEKVLFYGAVVGGSYFLYKSFSGKQEASGDALGTPGGTDSPMGEFGDYLSPTGIMGLPGGAAPIGGDYDAYQPVQEASPSYNPPSIQVNTSAPIKTTPKEPLGAPLNFLGVSLPGTPQPAPNKGFNLGDYGLGVLGLTGSYFSTFGKELFKGSKGLGENIITRTYKGGVEQLPFIGKKSSSYLFDDGVSGLKVLGSQAEGIAVKQGVEVLSEIGLKEGVQIAGKKAAKTGLSLLPFAGTVAGAEFDVRVSGKSRPLAYLANIAGDILGAASVAGGSFVGITETGFGGVALGVGGQVAGEQAVYKGASAISKLFNKEPAKIPELQKPSDIKTLTPYTLDDKKNKIKQLNLPGTNYLGSINILPTQQSSAVTALYSSQASAKQQSLSSSKVPLSSAASVNKVFTSVNTSSGSSGGKSSFTQQATATPVGGSFKSGNQTYTVVGRYYGSKKKK